MTSRLVWFAMYGFVVLSTAGACASTPAPKTVASTPPVPSPADVKGLLAGDIPGSPGALHVKLSASEDDNGKPRIDGVHVANVEVPCGSIFEKRLGATAYVSGPQTSSNPLTIRGGFARSLDANSSAAEGWLQLDTVEVVPGARVSGAMFLREKDVTAGGVRAHVEGHFENATVCVQSFAFQPISDVTVTIDHVAKHLSYGRVHSGDGGLGLELAESLSPKGEAKGRRISVDLPLSPDGKFFSGAPFDPLILNVQDGDEVLIVGATMTVAPFAYDEYGHVRGTLSTTAQTARRSKQLVEVNGRFDVQLGEDRNGVFAWTAAQHLPAGNATVRLNGQMSTTGSARYATSSSNGDRVDKVEIVDAADACDPHARAMISFTLIRMPSVAIPAVEPVRASGESVNGWVSAAQQGDEIRGWVFAGSTFSAHSLREKRRPSERVPNEVLAAGQFVAKRCRATP